MENLHYGNIMDNLLSTFEATGLGTILSQTIQEILIMDATLLPQWMPAPHFDCPGLKYPQKELDVRRLRNFRFILQDILKNTVVSLVEGNNFFPLIAAVENFKEKRKEQKKDLKNAADLPKKLRILRDDLKETIDQLRDLRDPGNLDVSKKLLEDEEKRIENICFNKKRYFDNYFGAVRKNFMNQLNSAEDKIHSEIKKKHIAIEQERRCTEEMQSFLQMRKIELSEELEQCMQLQDEMMAEKETKMQVLRIRKEHLEEETAKGELLLVQRMKEVEDWIKLRDEKEKENCAVGVVQTWWREMVTTRPKLVAPLIKEKKSKKNRKLKY